MQFFFPFLSFNLTFKFVCSWCSKLYNLVDMALLVACASYLLTVLLQLSLINQSRYGLIASRLEKKKRPRRSRQSTTIHLNRTDETPPPLHPYLSDLHNALISGKGKVCFFSVFMKPNRSPSIHAPRQLKPFSFSPFGTLSS
jgi:hypothetical protein